MVETETLQKLARAVEDIFALHKSVTDREKSMSDFDQLMTEIESQRAMIVEISKSVAVIHDHVTAATNGTIISSSTQTKIDSAMAAVTANRVALTVALEKVNATAQLVGTPVTQP